METEKSSLNLSEKLLDVTNRKVAHAAKMAYVKNKLNLIASYFSNNQPDLADKNFHEMIYDTHLEKSLELKKSSLCAYLNHLTLNLCENVIFPYEIYMVQSEKTNQLFHLNSHEEVDNWCINIIPDIFTVYKKSIAGGQYELSERIMIYIRNNYQRLIGLQDISDSLFVSTSYMCRRFKAETGMTIIDYLTKFRLMVASELLISTNMQIYKVGEAVGYYNNEAFVKAFKKNYGLTCGQYRKSKLNGINQI